jgi:hypothetical protein
MAGNIVYHCANDWPSPRPIERRNGKARIKAIKQHLREAKKAKDADLAFDLEMELDEARDRRRRA